MTQGRTTIYTDAMADAICERLAEGESLRSICRDEDMPHAATVCRWLAANEVFREQYARAREMQADALFDEALDIADTPVEGVKTKTLPSGSTETTTGDMIEHRRLQVETRKWMVGKLAPKKYGDKIDLTHANPDGTPIVFQTIYESKPKGA